MQRGGRDVLDGDGQARGYNKNHQPIRTGDGDKDSQGRRD
jgi:hypothetical protein